MLVRPPFRADVVKVTREFTESDVNAANQTVYPFPSKDLGTDTTAHKVVVVITCGGGSAGAGITSVTVGGSGASFIVSALGADNNDVEFWQIEGITSATGDIVITFPSARGNCGIGIYAVYDAAASASDTLSDIQTTGTPTGTIDIPANGLLLAADENQGNGALRTITWTGPTEDYDEQTDAGAGNPNAHSGASAVYDAEQTGLTVTATASGATLRNVMAACSFGPAT